MSLTDITTINTADLNLIQTLGKIAHRLPDLLMVRIQSGTAHVQVTWADAKWTAALLGLDQYKVTSTVAKNDYGLYGTGLRYMQNRYLWSQPGVPFTVVSFDNHPLPDVILADCEAVS